MTLNCGNITVKRDKNTAFEMGEEWRKGLEIYN